MMTFFLVTMSKFAPSPPPITWRYFTPAFYNPFKGVKILILLGQASIHEKNKQSTNDSNFSSSKQHWSETDNLNVSSYLREAKTVIEPRYNLNKILIFVR